MKRKNNQRSIKRVLKQGHRLMMLVLVGMMIVTTFPMMLGNPLKAREISSSAPTEETVDASSIKKATTGQVISESVTESLDTVPSSEELVNASDSEENSNNSAAENTPNAEKQQTIRGVLQQKKQDTEETTPLANYPVQLYQYDQQEEVLAESITNEQGEYVFEDLPSASYQLKVSEQAVNGIHYQFSKSAVIAQKMFGEFSEDFKTVSSKAIDLEQDDAMENFDLLFVSQSALEKGVQPRTAFYTVTADSSGQVVGSYTTIREALVAVAATAGTDFTIEGSGEETDGVNGGYGYRTIPNGKNVVLKSTGPKPLEITYTATSSGINSAYYFVIGETATFTMENVEIIGGYNAIGVDNKGTFIMNGGGIYAFDFAVFVQEGANFTLIDGELIGGTSSYSGVTLRINATFTMENGKIASFRRSGVTNKGYGRATFQMNGGEISDCTSDREGGGGVYLKSGTFTMTGGKISNNNTNFEGGGGVYSHFGTFTMTGGEISDNRVFSYRVGSSTYSASGGGIALVDCQGEISGGKIKNNIVEVATNNDNRGGGGIYAVSSRPPLKITGAEISGNSAANGGGVFGGVVLENTMIHDNTATDFGGGVYDYGAVSLVSGEISHNTARYGGGVYSRVFVLDGGKITQNKASLEGGGIYYGNRSYPENCTLAIKSGELTENIAGTNGGGIFVEFSGRESYQNPQALHYHRGIEISDKANIFDNQASESFSPPTNAAAFLNNQYCSFDGNLLNNDDINYRNPYFYVQYRSNNRHNVTYRSRDHYTTNTKVPVLDFSTTGLQPEPRYAFSHWNTEPDDSGTRYNPGDNITIANSDFVLYAIYKEVTNLALSVDKVDPVFGTVELTALAENMLDNGKILNMAWFATETTDTTDYSLPTNFDAKYATASLKGSDTNPNAVASQHTYKQKMTKNGTYWVKVNFDDGAGNISAIVKPMTVTNIYTQATGQIKGVEQGNPTNELYPAEDIPNLTDKVGIAYDLDGTTKLSAVTDGATVIPATNGGLPSMPLTVTAKDLKPTWVEDQASHTVDLGALGTNLGVVVFEYTRNPDYVDLRLSNEVAGDYADRNKAFRYTIILADELERPLAAGERLIYTGDVIAGSGATAPAGGTLTTDANGQVTIALKHGQVVNFSGVNGIGRFEILQENVPKYDTDYTFNGTGPTIGVATGWANPNKKNQVCEFRNVSTLVVASGITLDQSTALWVVSGLVTIGLAGVGLDRFRKRNGRHE